MASRKFAVCLGHTAKPEKHTVKCSPCVAHGERLMATSPDGEAVFAVCRLSGTLRKYSSCVKRGTRRNKIANGGAVAPTVHRHLAVCHNKRHTAKRPKVHGEENRVPGKKHTTKLFFFAVCQAKSTRQSYFLCRVPGLMHTAKQGFQLCGHGQFVVCQAKCTWRNVVTLSCACGSAHGEVTTNHCSYGPFAV